VTLDTLDRTVEDIDGRPEQVVEVGQETGVVQSKEEGVEYGLDRAGDSVVGGQRSRIRFANGVVAVELSVIADECGRGRRVGRLEVDVVAVDHHGDCPPGSGRALRGLRRSPDGGRAGLHRSCGRRAAEGGRRRLLCFAMQSRRARRLAAWGAGGGK
jgi:hypothetical protein